MSQVDEAIEIDTTKGPDPSWLDEESNLDERMREARLAKDIVMTQVTNKLKLLKGKQTLEWPGL